MNKKLLASALLCFFMFYACSTEKKDWKKAQSENTIEAYEAYLKRHPYPKSSLSITRFKVAKENVLFKKTKLVDIISAYEEYLGRYPKGLFVNEAIQRINEIIIDDRLPEVRDIRTVKIIVKKDFGKAKDAKVPFEGVVRILLQEAKITVINEETNDPDAILRIISKGYAKGISYWNIGYQYSGAILSGTISFEVKNGPIFKKSFQGQIGPFETVYYKKDEVPYPTPSSAPFLSAFYEPGSFVKKYIELMFEVFGLNCLTFGLDNDRYRIGTFKQWVLREKVGNDFGSDPTQWQIWWKKNSNLVKRK